MIMVMRDLMDIDVKLDEDALLAVFAVCGMVIVVVALVCA